MAVPKKKKTRSKRNKKNINKKIKQHPYYLCKHCQQALPYIQKKFNKVRTGFEPI
ncbi:50S ribosomal protein L32 [Candidatus Vidania fulgoroideae]|uniref:Large ribosomal subunit protein bL32 n=1 Tax=Candidatus Vidania fulgoroideorum TaxID=881286 RepID=A0A975ADT1_9PROT|nr:50S ribosomal protein L32 [Candidatus Vidania fulgoroideae]